MSRHVITSVRRKHTYRSSSLPHCVDVLKLPRAEQAPPLITVSNCIV
jgi:hypothetical protein